METEWSLLSSHISLLEEDDLLAFDEDLHDAVCWEDDADGLSTHTLISQTAQGV